MKTQKINVNTTGRNVYVLYSHGRAYSRLSLKAGFKHFHSAPLKELGVLKKPAGEDLKG